MTGLALTIPLNEYETPASYVSRLSRRNADHNDAAVDPDARKTKILECSNTAVRNAKLKDPLQRCFPHAP